MAEINVPCNVNGEKVPIKFYIGQPDPKRHPIQHQADWLAKERGINVPPETMESLKEMHEIAKKNNIPFDELAVAAMEQNNKIK